MNDITFINHACFKIDDSHGDVLFDPWFSGKVFNNSWSLLRDTEYIELKNVKYIIITHEHPDHLHWQNRYCLWERLSLQDCLR